MPNASRTTRYSSLSLKDVVCLCAESGNDEVWEEFVSRVGRPISLTIMRTASRWGEPSRSLVEDLVQATYLKLWEGGCRLLREVENRRRDRLGRIFRLRLGDAFVIFQGLHEVSSKLVASLRILGQRFQNHPV